ncbi:MAG: hypothetical protein Q9217_000550 [Psora testacea]
MSSTLGTDAHPAAAPPNQTPGHPSFRRWVENSGPAEPVRLAIVESDRADSVSGNSPKVEQPAGYEFDANRTSEYNAHDGMPVTSLSSAQTAPQGTQNLHFTHFMKPKFARAPIKEAGRVAYLGESSNLSLLVHDRHGTTDVVHYPLPDSVKGTRSRMTELDNLEMEILHQRGAFLLPPRALCDELVDAFFKWIAPVVPVINKSRFMTRYRDTKNPPSLLLLQAILLAGSRVCTNPQLMDSSGSTTPAAMTFYKRAKALYDANYEDDRVTIVQALVLMGWYWEGPEDVTKNVFYWTRVATVVAQGSGMHRSVEQSQLGKADKKLWKRIWWTLFTRDRSVAVALGRPVHINTDDSDVEMVTEDDFIEDEGDQPAKYPPDNVHVQFFLQYVRLCEIMGLVLSQQYSVASKARRQNAIDLTHSDMALADWLQNCPKEVYWEKPKHNFCVYSLFSALLMHIYQMRSSVPSVVTATQERLHICMNALREVSKVWLVAKMVHTLFESILGNKMLEDKLQKAAGRRHKKPRLENRTAAEKDDTQPRQKYSDLEIGFTNGPPAPQVSYERSRPQTPAVTPQRELGQQNSASMAPMAAPPTTDGMRQPQDAFMGSSRNTTRPPTPFNGNYSIPATPPDLYLVTRDSPHISHQLWENFQPGYLFPENTNISMPQFSGEQTLDPQLQMQTSAMLQPPLQSQPQLPRGLMGMHGMQQQHGWQDPFPNEHSPEEQWSSGNMDQGPVAPTTLNMDDW